MLTLSVQRQWLRPLAGDLEATQSESETLKRRVGWGWMSGSAASVSVLRRAYVARQGTVTVSVPEARGGA